MRAPLLIALVCLAGCARRTDAVPAAPASAASSAAPSAAPVASAQLPVPPGAKACGDHGCLLFDSTEAAFQFAISSNPRVLALGEAHAQKGKEGVASSAKRFTDTLLPVLKGRASDLLLELMMPNNTCQKKTEEAKKQQKVVTEKQAETNQNEYVKMGDKARTVGIVPDLLRPSCDDLGAINDAGADSIPTFLSTIARLTRTQAERLLERNERSPAEENKMIVTYGGVMHNDLAPSKVASEWSFGPQLSDRVKGRYVELDMFVPEFIEDNDTWKKLEWVAHYDRAAMGSKAVVFRPRPGSFVLVFPMSAP
jgi:hypothetical protein